MQQRGGVAAGGRFNSRGFRKSPTWGHSHTTVFGRPAAPGDRLSPIRPPKTPRWRVKVRGSATRDRSPVPEPIELSRTGRLRPGKFPRSGPPGPGPLVCGCGLVRGCPGINLPERRISLPERRINLPERIINLPETWINSPETARSKSQRERC